MRQGQTSEPVVSKVVTRHFWGGKGYATLTLALRARAKAELIEMVLGPWVEGEAYSTPYLGSGDVETYRWWELENAHRPESKGTTGYSSDGPEERKAWIDSRFALFFPHDSEPDALEQGCMTAGENPPDNFTCRTDQYGDYQFESCKWAQEKWIRKRVSEMRNAAKEDVTGGR